MQCRMFLINRDIFVSGCNPTLYFSYNFNNRDNFKFNGINGKLDANSSFFR